MERCHLKVISGPDLDLQLELDSRLEAQFPQLARLLEWMLRWADRSVLITHSSRKKTGGTAKPAAIRVRSSAPAVLTALSLMECRYTAALLGDDEKQVQIRYTQVHEKAPSVAPVLQTVSDWRRERESSVDTGYPASAGTPITLLDLDHPHGHSSEVFEIEELQKKQNDSTVYQHEDVREPVVIAESDGSSSIDDSSLKETSEESAHIPHISVQLMSKSRDGDQALTLADLENPKTSEDFSECSSQQTLPKSNGIPTEASCVHATQTTVTHQPAERPGPSVFHATVGFDVASQTQTPPHGENHHPDPVRQLFQDELFRLVQLQQVNFMSLMQVVGASFANTALFQANPLLSQLNNPAVQVPPAQTSGAPSSNIPTSNFQNALRQDTQDAVMNQELRKNNMNSIESEPVVRSAEESNHMTHSRPNDQQEIRQLLIPSAWPQNSRTTSPVLIPPSQGLLTTLKNVAPRQTPSDDQPRASPILNPTERTAPGTQGLRLLRLPPPRSPPGPVREAWPPPSTSDITVAMPPPPDLHLNQYTAVRSHSPLIMLNRNQGQRLSPAVNAGQPAKGPSLMHVPPTNHPMPLLHIPTRPSVRQYEKNTTGVASFHTSQQLSTDLKQGSVCTPRLIPPEELRTLAVGMAISDSFQKPQLLHIDPAPQRVDFRSNEPSHAPRLIPLEQLMTWARTKQDSKLRLLKANTVLQNKPTTSPSKKRLKRMADKKREQKVVSFRPDDSIIPPAQPEDKYPVNNENYVIPLGSFDSMLTGQRLLVEHYATSAELHAFAATQKIPPEVHDACTSTDPVPPHRTTDKAVSVQLPVSPDFATTSGKHVNPPPTDPPDLFLNLHLSKSVLPEETSSNFEPDPQTNNEWHSGLKESTDLQDSLCPQGPELSPSCPPPSSAQLHLQAASVINSAWTNSQLQTEEQEDCSLTDHTDSGPPMLLLSKPEPRGDPLTLEMLSEITPPAEILQEQRLVERTPFFSQASTDLADMDARLAVLEGIANCMDREFDGMKLLVDTINPITPKIVTCVNDEPHSSLIRVRKEATSYKHRVQHVVELENLEEVDEEEQDIRFSSTPLPAVGFPSQRESLTHLVPNVSQDLTGSMNIEDSEMPADSTLGLTGLSDVADILGELVQKGALSPSDFHLTPAQETRCKSTDQLMRARIEEERKEVRAWMRRKQRERLAEYRKQRNAKREKEHAPFISNLSQKPTSKDLERYRKEKEDKDKALLQTHHSVRVQEAFTLMKDMLATPLILPTVPQHINKAKDSRPGSRTQATGNNRSPKGRGRSVSSLGKTVVLQRRGASAPPGNLTSRFGLHRPASALPGDRLSQVTRRGMLTDQRSRTNMKTPVQKSIPGLNKQEPKMMKKQATVQEEEEERNVVSPWDVPLEIRRLLGLKDISDEQSWMKEDENEDVLSQSTNSLLSKLDWANIERIIGEEEEHQH